jgi:hypothetical protein
VVIRPAISAVTVEPISSGISISPLSVADRCCTVCWYSGRKVSAPNMARPSRKLIAVTSEKFRLRNTCSGRTGSAARRSTAMNPAVATTAKAPRPMICADRHGYCVPPQVVSRTSEAAATASSIEPR